jgi:anti-sigma regulatory factor (Ser/Thr protein kinase)
MVEVGRGAPLGTLPYSHYTEVETTLADGEIFLLYTDGLVEERGRPMQSGLDRLLAAVRGATSPDKACARVARDLVSPEGASDDIAFVAFQRAAVPEELRLRLPADPAVLSQVRQTLRRWLQARGASEDDIGMITLACGEACANAIEHAYSPAPAFFEIEASTTEDELTLAIRDIGQWRPPRGQHRGRGLKIMESIMDAVDVDSTPGGTRVLMRRRLPA